VLWLRPTPPSRNSAVDGGEKFLKAAGPRLGVIGDSPGAITEAGQQVKEVVGFPVEAEGRQADRATATTIVRRG
jgi:hypothetical protein